MDRNLQIGVTLYAGKESKGGFGCRARGITETALPQLQISKVGTDRRFEEWNDDNNTVRCS